MFSFDLISVTLKTYSPLLPTELFVKIGIPGNRSLWVNHLPRIWNNQTCSNIFTERLPRGTVTTFCHFTDATIVE